MMRREEKVTENALIALYKEQWSAIRHFDTLDWRTISISTPIVALLSGILVFLHEPPWQMILLITVSSMSISFYGIWTVFRNRLTMEFKIEMITNVEKHLNLDQVIPSLMCGYKRAENLKELLSRFFISIRGPLFISYLFILLFSGCLGSFFICSDILFSFITGGLISINMVATVILIQCFDYFTKQKVQMRFLKKRYLIPLYLTSVIIWLLFWYYS